MSRHIMEFIGSYPIPCLLLCFFIANLIFNRIVSFIESLGQQTEQSKG